MQRARVIVFEPIPGPFLMTFVLLNRHPCFFQSIVVRIFDSFTCWLAIADFIAMSFFDPALSSVSTGWF
jgi:hypothetical protein